jgi:hypothetical protein
MILLCVTHPEREFTRAQLEDIFDADHRVIHSRLRELVQQGWVRVRLVVDEHGRHNLWSAGPVLLRFLAHYRTL